MAYSKEAIVITLVVVIVVIILGYQLYSRNNRRYDNIATARDELGYNSVVTASSECDNCDVVANANTNTSNQIGTLVTTGGTDEPNISLPLYATPYGSDNLYNYYIGAAKQTNPNMDPNAVAVSSPTDMKIFMVSIKINGIKYGTRVYAGLPAIYNGDIIEGIPAYPNVKFTAVIN